MRPSSLACFEITSKINIISVGSIDEIPDSLNWSRRRISSVKLTARIRKNVTPELRSPLNLLTSLQLECRHNDEVLKWVGDCSTATAELWLAVKVSAGKLSQLFGCRITKSATFPGAKKEEEDFYMTIRIYR